MPNRSVTAGNRFKLKSEDQVRQARADSTKEASVEKYFMAQARRYRCMQRKLSPLDGVVGWPDRLLVWPCRGVTDYIELKRPKGGRYEPKQEKIQADLVGCGCFVSTLHTRAAVDAYFKARAKELGVKPVAAAPRTKRQGLLSAYEFLGSEPEAE